MLDLIYDRTVQDVTNKTKKGCYNAEDLNRVTAAVDYLVKELGKHGYIVSGYQRVLVNHTVTHYTGEVAEDGMWVVDYVERWSDYTWIEGDIPTKPQMERYRLNVAAVRAVLAAMPATPETPDTIEKLTYQKANDLEKILANVEVVFESMLRVFVRSGSPWAYAGTGLYFDGGVYG